MNQLKVYIVSCDQSHRRLLETETEKGRGRCHDGQMNSEEEAQHGV